jgi:hypothetical protein
MSMTVYDNAGGTFLVDYEMEPDAGSANPFRVATNRLGGSRSPSGGT